MHDLIFSLSIETSSSNSESFRRIIAFWLSWIELFPKTNISCNPKMLHMVIVETIVQCPNVLVSCVFVESTALTNTDKIYIIYKLKLSMHRGSINRSRIKLWNNPPSPCTLYTHVYQFKNSDEWHIQLYIYELFMYSGCLLDGHE